MSKVETKEVIERSVGENVSVFADFKTDTTKELGEGVVEAIITTGALDHHNERINVDGVDLSTYHGTVLYGHDYSALPIGKTISITKMKGKIKAKFQLFTDVYPFAKTVYDIIQAGGLTDVSIGGIVKKWNEDFTVIEEMAMKEFSVVSIGANPQAMITSKALGDKSVDDIRKEYRDFVREALLDKMADLGEDEINQAVKTLENLVATLKESAKAASSAGDKQPADVKRIIRVGLMDNAKAANKASERVIKLIKLK